MTMALTLTSREVEVVRLVAQGCTNKEVACALGLSEHTIKAHLSRIYEKLGCGARAEAVSIANLSGLLSSPLRRCQALPLDVMAYQATVRSQVLTPFGALTVEPGDWVVRYDTGEVWPLKGRSFVRQFAQSE